MEVVKIENATRVYKIGEVETKALAGVDLSIQTGEFTALVGPSGSGKTTLLQLIGCLDQPTSGELYLKDRPIVRPGPERGMIFQEFALFPWKTVIKNIEFGLEIKGLSNRERTKIACRYIDLIGLHGFEDSYPHEISGGMKQRVAVARALANDPEVLLMDEPFGTLDAQTRNLMQEELLSIWKNTGKTILFVTHCVNETSFLAQRAIVLTPRPGRIRKIIPIDLKHPRKRNSQETDAIKNRLMGLIGEKN